MKTLIEEWKKIFRNRMLIAMMIVIPLVPIIYSGLMLGAYWDPFGNTSNLPVAVVNLDKPSELEGNTLTIGDELVNNLKENDDLKWHFVNSEEASDGFENGDYYMVITIPEDFSEKATTVLNDEPEKMNLTYEVNPGRNYFTVTISEQAMNRINQEISASVTKEYTRAIFSNVNEISESFAEAADGASEIDNGVEQLIDGNTELTSNLNKLADSTLTFQNGVAALQVGVGEFINGSAEINTGVRQLNEGIIQYTNGVSQLQKQTAQFSREQISEIKLDPSSLNQLASGSQALNEGLLHLNQQLPSQDEMTQLVDGLKNIQLVVNQLEQSTSQFEIPPELLAQINGLNDAINSVQPATINALEGYSDIRHALNGNEGLIQGSTQVSNGVNTLVNGSSELVSTVEILTVQLPLLADAINQLDSQSGTLRQGSLALVEGTEALNNQLPELENGTVQLYEGANQLNDGATQLAEGSTQLGEGMADLKKGTTELEEKLTEGADNVASIQTTDDNYEMLAEPITLTESKTNEVPNYGHALAPMFISLGLYIGALAFNLVFPINETVSKPTSVGAWWFSKFTIGFVPAVIGALVLVAIVIWGMGLQVEHIGKFTIIAVLGSLTYMFFMMLLVITLGNPGRFIAMILLVLQLGSSGGMFPLALQNDFFIAINPYMPMTYVIYGLREGMTLSIGNDVFVISIIVLICCIIVFNAMLYLFMRVKNKRDHALAYE